MLLKEPVFLGAEPTTPTLIRARSVVQVHRPTIKITSKYAAILTFPLLGNTSQKTNLPTICQFYDWPNSCRGLRPFTRYSGTP